MIGLVMSVIAIAGLFLAGFGVFLVIQAVQRNTSVRGGVLLTIVGLVIAVLFFTMNAGLVEVGSTEVAVVFNSFSGELSGTPLGPGMHLIIPGVQQATIYSTSRQEYTMAGDGAGQDDIAVTALTNDGQQVIVDVTVFYLIDPGEADILHQRWQHRYADELVRPVVRNQTYTALTRFTVEEIYGAGREQLQQTIEDAVRADIADDGLELADVLLRNITFSDEYVAAIEQKQVAQQQAEEARFRVQEKEQQADQARAVAQGEADADRIRAEGEAAALELINQQLEQNPLLIQWRYVETLSDNVRILVIPSNSPFLFDMNQLTSAAGADLTDESPSTEEDDTTNN